MSWFVLILISTNLFAVINLFDKFFCAKKFKNTLAFAVFNCLLSVIFILGLSFFINFSYPIGWPLFLAISSGPVYFLMWVLWWQSLKGGEISRSVTIFNVAPIFNAFLAVLFLAELKWLAILLIVAGAVICSWESNARSRFNYAYILVVLAAIAGAVGNVLSKFAMREIGPLAIYAISFYASLPLYLFLLTKKGVLAEVKASLKTKELVIVLFLRSLINFIAICFFYLTLSSGPVSLVAAVGGIGPLLVFIYSTAVSLFWPKFIKEELHRQALFSKTVAITLIVIGVVLINS